ncbi:MAG: hypothetical protein ACI8RD_008796, partial [Bacillariaceae sp.]
VTKEETENHRQFMHSLRRGGETIVVNSPGTVQNRSLVGEWGKKKLVASVCLLSRRFLTATKFFDEIRSILLSQQQNRRHQKNI